MNCTRLTWYILWCIGSVHVVVQAIVVSRQTLDLFSNPNPENCVDDKRYCSGRKATCFGENCCTCKCRKGYSTFHSPGVSYYLENGTAAYRFDKKESCAWNHYAHEGCRFIQEHRSNSSNPFLPLINLEKNGTLHLKVALKGIYRCNQYHLFSKRPFERAWVNFKGENIFKTEWHQTDRSDLTLEWSSQGPMYGGILFKLNFTCRSALKNGQPEPCMILKIKGSYDTETNSSEVPTDKPGVDGQQKLEPKTTAETATLPTLLVSTSQTPQEPMGAMNKTDSPGATSNGNTKGEHGETFWILVILFVAFAFFEVLCVVLFLFYRRRKHKQRSKNLMNESLRSHPVANYDNYGMTVTSANSIQSYPENVQLYENDELDEPRHIYARMGTFRRDKDPSPVKNGIQRNKTPSVHSSKRDSRILKSGSIIVLPKDCVIVHASGSRKSGHSERDRGSIAKHEDGNGNKDVESMSHNSDDNPSLFSWGSFSTFYGTSTDEDYVSGGNPLPWENETFYEEPDKLFSKDERRPSLPSKTFGLERLFSLQESVISATEGDDNEHIYETAENVISNEDYKSFKDKSVYDLPEDAIVEGLVKPNRGSLKHILEDKPAENSEQSLNLGSAFANHDESNEDNEDVKLRPKPKSTLFFQEMGDNLQNSTSVC